MTTDRIWSAGVGLCLACAVPGMSFGQSALVLGAPVGSSTERAEAAGFGAAGFSISIDNEVVAGSAPPANPQRSADLIAAAAGVDVRFDGLDAPRLLNVTTLDGRVGYASGAPVTFRAISNYPAYIVRAEVRILDRSRPGTPVVGQIPVAPNGTASWQMPGAGDGTYAYVLRVYDAQGRYDETRPLALTRTEREGQGSSGPFVDGGAGEDRTARRGIPATGGAITVSGQGAAPWGTVMVMGEPVVADATGRFVARRILPAGDQVVAVTIGGRTYVRDVLIPTSDWFYVVLADVTLGRRSGGPNDLEERYTNGRLAYYLRGQTESGYRITSSLDTRDGPIEDIFRRLNDKDPRRILDRLREDATDLYPTYGDDSTFYDDTPTSGAVYLRVETERLRLTWGDFDAGITGGGLLQNGRSLYGAELRYQSVGVTEAGEPRFAATVYAAQPETVPQRDILRGTGGSVYYLSRQDVLSGTAKLLVQVVDPETGRVIETRPLVEGADYTIDHLQGVVILTHPLNSSANGGSLIRDGGADYDVSLVAQYEYSPTTNTSDSTVYGGPAEGWVSETLRFGATYMQEETGAGTQRMMGVDLRWQPGAQTYAELEFAQTEGPGFARTFSTDGGLTDVRTGGGDFPAARALRFDARVDLQDMGLSQQGYVGLYYEVKEAGYSTLQEDITADQELIGVVGDIAFDDRFGLRFEAERFRRDGGEDRTEAEIAISYKVTQAFTVDFGIAHLRQDGGAVIGSRTDAAVRLTYAPSDDLSLYAFAQQTLQREGLPRNNRYGAGVTAQLTSRIALTAEASDGDAGPGAAVQLRYQASADNEIYIGYSLDPTRHGAGSPLSDQGTIVLGGRYRLSDSITTWTESTLDLPGNQQSFTQMYGLSFMPNPQWTVTGSIERGQVRDAEDGDFDRLALSLGAAYTRDDDLSARLRLEYRHEDGAGTARDRETWALSAGYSNRVAEDWRILASVDAFYSQSAEGDFQNGEYVRASLGYAYRPIDNERLNVLFGYSYLRDLPAVDQLASDGTAAGARQVSHVLSIAANYDLTEELTVGAKLGYRSSEVAERGSDVFTANSATLAVLRADWHVVDQWDIMAEGRILYTHETETVERGAAVGVYRHLNENVRVGLIYEWGDVSDQITDINYSSQGIGLNIVATF